MAEHNTSVSTDVINHELNLMKQASRLEIELIGADVKRFHYPSVDVWLAVIHTQYAEETDRILAGFSNTLINSNDSAEMAEASNACSTQIELLLLNTLFGVFWTGFSLGKSRFMPSQCRCNNTKDG